MAEDESWRTLSLCADWQWPNEGRPLGTDSLSGFQSLEEDYGVEGNVEPSTSCPALTPGYSTTPETSSFDTHPRNLNVDQRPLYSLDHAQAYSFCDTLTPSQTQLQPGNQLVSMDSDAGDAMVCYGRLPNIKARLETNPSNVRTLSKGNFVYFLIASHKDYFYLNDKVQNFAFISLRVCNTLQKLQDRQLLYKAYVLADSWTKIVKAWRPSAKTGREFTFSVVVCGSRNRAMEVGNIFSDAKLFLQQLEEFRPDHSLDLVNPHWLHLPSFSKFEKSFEDGSEQQAEESPLLLQSVFDATSQHDALDEASIDARVSSNLHRHQRTAVSFILRKEKGTLPDSMSPWQGRQTQGGHCYYEHAITGDHETNPMKSETPGGILADEMGGGKTASLLAVIVATLDEARSLSKNTGNTNLRTAEALPGCPATLVIVPSELLLAAWESEIRRHIRPDTLRIHRFHGAKKEIDPGRLQNIDLVLTTYATVESDARGYKCLSKVCWYRMVLDEAHVIRSDTTKQHASVRVISARSRWCLTGTPMQNKLEDFGSLLRFLQVSQLEDRANFRKHILLPIEHHKDTTSLQKLLPWVYLRRRRAAFGVPEPAVILKRLRLSKEERGRYEQIKSACSDAIKLAQSRESLGDKRRSTLRQSLRLRITCNNGTFEKPPPEFAKDPFSLRDTEGAPSGKGDCPSCSKEIWTIKEEKSSYHHICGACASNLCEQCLPEYAISIAMNCSKANRLCQHCQKTFKPRTYDGVASASHFEKLTDLELDANTSTKLDAVARDIVENKATCNNLVFSTWRNTLELLLRLLRRKGIPAKLIHGQTSVSERTAVLKSFEEHAAGAVLLMTIGTGGVGLNIFSANRIHLVEPQWNPANEEQAYSRAVRLGQDKQVTVIKYVMDDTVEIEAVQRKQATKRKLAESFKHEHEMISKR